LKTKNSRGTTMAAAMRQRRRNIRRIKAHRGRPQHLRLGFWVSIWPLAEREWVIGRSGPTSLGHELFLSQELRLGSLRGV
jgi:hypothetical protein